MAQIKSLANSRFLFLEQKLEDLDVASAIGKLDSVIHHSTQIQLAFDNILLEFSSDPRSGGFKGSTVLIGREILGHDSETLAMFKYKDYKRREVNFFVLNIDASDIRDWNKLFGVIGDSLPDSDSCAWIMSIKDDFSQIEIQFS